MKPPPTPRAALLFLAALVCAVLPPAASAALDIARIDALTGLKGVWNATEKVHKVSLPRTDLPISVDGWTMPPFMGLTSWAAFSEGRTNELMVAGDLVLFEDEVNPVMLAALDAGLSVTALHNHFFFDHPRVYFMHIGGEGSLEILARGVQAALAAQKQVRAQQPQPATMFGSGFNPQKNAITGAAIEGAIGAKGTASNGMFKVVIGRTVKMPCGCAMGKEMGVNTWAAFAGTDDDALVDGDFVATAAELQGVLKSLRHDGINIVAIHSHMADEEPRLIFLHYWGRGRAADLAASVKRALATQHL